MLHTCSMMFYLFHDSGRDQTNDNNNNNNNIKIAFQLMMSYVREGIRLLLMKGQINMCSFDFGGGGMLPS